MALRLIAEKPVVAEVRLFGSLARGDQTGTSDADVLVVLHSADSQDPHRRTLAYLPYFDMERGVDLMVLTRAELEQRLADQDHLIMRILDESQSLTENSPQQRSIRRG
jgi:predicted nucleotidyltransferase